MKAKPEPFRRPKAYKDKSHIGETINYFGRKLIVSRASFQEPKTVRKYATWLLTVADWMDEQEKPNV